MRPYVSVFLGTSLDMKIARADGGIEWLEEANTTQENYGYEAFMETVDTLVIGRSTYDTVLGFDPWPYTGKRVVVMTHRPLISRWGEEAASGALLSLLERLQQEGVRHVYLDGGQMVQQGLREGVVDALTLSVLPIVLGEGRSLFGGGIPEQRWKRKEVRSFQSGVVQLQYERTTQ